MPGEKAAESGNTLLTMFANQAKKTNANAHSSEPNFARGDTADGAVPPKSKKRLSVERIYQKKTQLEHILLRPDTYIGSVEKVTQQMWVFDEEANEGKGGMVQKELTYVPGLFKIFDEILVNAADNKQRDKSMTLIKITIDPDNNKISIWNNGKGIPIVEHQVEKIYVPELIFGHLLTSSNYNDEERKVTGGRNGYGAKLCNIFSTKFTCVTACKEYGKKFKQTWTDNMLKAGAHDIKPYDGPDYTEITFYPDLKKFKMEHLDEDICAIFKRRAYDIVASTQGVKVMLNGTKLPIKNFQDYANLYTRGKTYEDGNDLKLVYEKVNDRWEVAVTMSDKGFQQVSFANSIATTKGGRHVDYVTDQLVGKLVETVKKKNKGGVQVRPFQVKNHIWVFINCLIENPTFDSQTKENMTLQAKSFGSKCQLPEKFINSTMKVGIVESIMQWVRFKAQTQLNQKCHASKRSKLRGIPKLDDANDAGGKNSINCTLILTEGDSAKTLAVSGLGVVGRDRYGVFPLRGKVLNVREATHKQIMENAEINNVIKIVGLQYKKSYNSIDDLRSLRYGKMMIMTDQDVDGSHIKGLLVNFIHHNWPQLLHLPFLEEFITPIVKVTKGNQQKSFYSLPEFDEWKRDTDNWQSWKVKYYKGLGTSTAKEAKEYFSDMDRHKIKFKYSGPDDDQAVLLAFGKKKADDRKEWLTNGLQDRKERREMGLSDVYLYGKDTRAITYSEFVNKELIQFSIYDNERSIPSLVDGLKPGQRKVLFTCLKRNDKREVKVAQLAGSVAELSAYHHGEQSLNMTIVNLAQNFIGSNNVNLLQPIGQFGTRLHGGKDCASPRYIFTMLSPLAKLLFVASDEPGLRHLYDDNQKIEPEWYCPVIPMLLVNGAEGIGTGWSCKVQNYDPRQIIRNLRKMIAGQEPELMTPFFKNFTGTIQQISDDRFVVSGEVAVLDNCTVEITELPVRTWTQNYKESVLEPMLLGTDKVQPTILDYKEYHTDTTVRFVIKMSEAKIMEAEAQGLHKFFKLQTTLSTGNMVLFDHNGCIKKYSSPQEILQEFYTLRLDRYRIRKEHLDGCLTAESLRLDNQARFILEKIERKVVVENVKKKDLIQVLVNRGYDSDPVKAWKAAQRQKEAADNPDSQEDSDTEEAITKDGPDYDYLVGMPMWNLTKEKKEELLKKKADKAVELDVLRAKTPKDLWKEDLDKFSEELDKVEANEREEEQSCIVQSTKTGKGRVAKVKKFAREETKPSTIGRRVEPNIEEYMKNVEKAKKAKEAKERREVKKENGEMDIFDEEEDAPKPLAERLSLSNEKQPGAKPKTKDGMKQTKLLFKPIKKSKKEESDKSDDETPFIPRDKPSRRAAATVKYTFSDDEDAKSEEKADLTSDDQGPDFGDEMSDYAPDESDEDFMPSHPKTSRSPKKSPQKKSIKLKQVAAGGNVPDSKQTSSAQNLESYDSEVQDNYTKSFEYSDSPKAKDQKKKVIKAKIDHDGKKKKVDDGKKALKDKKQSSAVSADSKPKKTKAVDSDMEIIDSDDEPPRAAPTKKHKFQFSDDEDEPVPKATKSAPSKVKKVKKRPAIAADSESEDEFVLKKKPKAQKKKKKASDSDDDEDDSIGAGFSEIPVEPRERKGRAKQQVKYNFSSDDDDDDLF